MEWEVGYMICVLQVGWFSPICLFSFSFSFSFLFFPRAFVICWVHDFYSRLVGFIELPLIVDTFIHAQTATEAEIGEAR